METSLIIKSFLPNPEGSDKGAEIFSIANNSGSQINLSGWKVRDESGKNYYLSGRINPSQEIIFPASGSFILNNNGETLHLFNPLGELVDELGYVGSASEGRVIQKYTEITQELKNELFDPLALASNTDVIKPSGTFSFAVLAVLAITILGFIAHKKWPKNEEQNLSEHYGEDNFF